MYIYTCIFGTYQLAADHAAGCGQVRYYNLMLQIGTHLDREWDVYIYIYIYICVCVCVCVNIYTYIFIYLFTYICIYFCIHVYVYIYMCVCRVNPAQFEF